MTAGNEKVLIKTRVIGRLNKVEVKKIREVNIPKHQRYFVIGQYLISVNRCSINFFDAVKRSCKLKTIPLPFYTSHFPTDLAVVKYTSKRHHPLYLHLYYDPSIHIILNLANFTILSTFMIDSSLYPSGSSSFLPYKKHQTNQS